MRRMLPIVLLVAAVATLSQAETEEASIAVRIDNTITISTDEVNTFVDSMLKSQGQGMPPDALDQYRPQVWQQAVDQLILQKLLVRAAAADTAATTDEEVQAFFKERLPEGMTLADIAAREGIPEAKIVEDVKNNLLINKHLEAKVANVAAPTDEELQTLFDETAERRPDFAEAPEQVEARHILIRVPDDASDEDKAKAREKLEGIRKEIVEGKSEFAAMAEQHSDCPSGKRAGGNLGFFARGQMVKPFDDAAFGQEPGVVGQIVETSFGLHLIEVLNKKAAEKRTVESERGQLTEMASRKKKGEVVQNYLEELKKAAAIEILATPPAPPAPVPPAPAMEEGAAERELPVWAQ